ncbi:MAG: hypothetical protein ACFFEK_13430 [Candidatus Thorarchaeota archaeon]
MGEIQDRPGPTITGSQSEYCVVALIIFTIVIGFIAAFQSPVQYFSLAAALGLSAIATAIFHLAKVLQETQ